MAPAYAANFTDIPEEGFCERCRQKVPVDELHVIESLHNGMAAWHVCKGCMDHYIHKADTVHQGHVTHVQSNIAASQHGDRSINVQPVGDFKGLNINPTHAQSILALLLAGSNTTSGNINTLQNLTGMSGLISGLVVSTFGKINTGRSSMPPPLIAAPAIGVQAATSGYTPNHEHYQVHQKYHSSLAYARDVAQVGSVTTKLISMQLIKLQQHETARNVPVYSGYYSLHDTLYQKILEPWNLYSHNYPLHQNDFILRYKDWGRIEPPNNVSDETPVIVQFFFRPAKKGGPPIFKTGCINIFLQIQPEFYEEMLQHKDETDIIGKKSATATVGNPQAIQGKSARKAIIVVNDGRESDSEEEKIQVVDTSKHAGSAKNLPCSKSDSKRTASSNEDSRPISRNWELHSAFKLRQAVKSLNLSVSHPHQLNYKNNTDQVSVDTNLKVVHVHIIPVHNRSLEDLINNPDPLMNLDKGRRLTAQLTFDTNVCKIGNFKFAYPGTIDNSPFSISTESATICVKKSYYMKCNPTTAGGITGGLGLPAPSFNIPQVRFVDAALVIEQGADKSVFLLEEFIEGKFQKYLNNDSVLPRLFLKDDDAEYLAEFLSFSQHIQYWKTKRLAFVSDYQGSTTLLTDPKIVTNQELGYIFTAGNLPDGYENFECQHICNFFCKFYQLPRDYDAWGDAVQQQPASKDQTPDNEVNDGSDFPTYLAATSGANHHVGLESKGSCSGGRVTCGRQYNTLPAVNGGEEREGDTPPLSFGAGWPN
ncbi:alpha-kinase family-domain-containing protein [Suillus ampliporus]|nr:alpha-kinase family-domain-containing protein [Suillus ampliporus]